MLNVISPYKLYIVGPVWTANFDDIPMDTGTSTAPAANSNSPSTTSSSTDAPPEVAWSSSPTTLSNSETGWANFCNFNSVRYQHHPLQWYGC